MCLKHEISLAAFHITQLESKGHAYLVMIKSPTIYRSCSPMQTSTVNELSFQVCMIKQETEFLLSNHTHIHNSLLHLLLYTVYIHKQEKKYESCNSLPCMYSFEFWICRLQICWQDTKLRQQPTSQGINLLHVLQHSPYKNPLIPGGPFGYLHMPLETDNWTLEPCTQLLELLILR